VKETFVEIYNESVMTALMIIFIYNSREEHEWSSDASWAAIGIMLGYGMVLSALEFTLMIINIMKWCRNRKRNKRKARNREFRMSKYGLDKTAPEWRPSGIKADIELEMPNDSPMTENKLTSKQ
jgi:hypothetical protein